MSDNLEFLRDTIQGIHSARNCSKSKPSNWGLFEDDTVKYIFLNDLIEGKEINNDNLILVKHDLICWKGMDDPLNRSIGDHEGKYKYCQLKMPGVLVKTTKNPKKLPYRMIDGSHRMAKRYLTQPNEYHYGSSLFYVISEETFFKYLRDPPN